MKLDRASRVDRATERFVLVVGGSADHLGGVEAFCERSAIALAAHGGWRSERIAAGTAYLTLARLPVFFKGLRELVSRRKSSPDIVWIQYVNLPDLAFVVLARLLGMRVMVTPHLGVQWRSQGNRLLRGLSELILRLAHQLALISPTQELELALPRNVPRALIRNFLPAEVLLSSTAQLREMPAVMQIIHSSRLSEGKGTFLVVEVCRRLREQGVPFKARITGTGSPQTLKLLGEMIAKYGLGSQVSVLGRVPEDDLLDYLRRSDVLLHLSSIDSYPLIVLEAMACSATPVVMELAGARDMVETYGGYVAPRADAVAATVEWLSQCDLSELRERRGKIAAAVRNDYAWRRCAARLAGALDRAIGVVPRMYAVEADPPPAEKQEKRPQHATHV